MGRIRNFIGKQRCLVIGDRSQVERRLNSWRYGDLIHRKRLVHDGGAFSMVQVRAANLLRDHESVYCGRPEWMEICDELDLYRHHPYDAREGRGTGTLWLAPSFG